jgi:hypothetical protein
MVWVWAIIKFIVSASAIFSLLLFIVVCITSVTNPEIEVVDGEIINKNQKAAIVLAIITAVLFGLLIAIP